MKWRLLPPMLVVAVGVGLGTAFVTAQLLTETQTTSGSVTNTSGNPQALYICEPSGSGSQPCPGDDSGADEIIFEATEDMFAGKVVPWDIRLRNIDFTHWDVTGVEYDVAEAADPGNDCDENLYEPVLLFTFTNYPNDEHLVSTSPQPLPKMGWESSGTWWTIHVIPGEWQDIRIRATLPVDTPATSGPSQLTGRSLAIRRW